MKPSDYGTKRIRGFSKRRCFDVVLVSAFVLPFALSVLNQGQEQTVIAPTPSLASTNVASIVYEP